MGMTKRAAKDGLTRRRMLTAGAVLGAAPIAAAQTGPSAADAGGPAAPMPPSETAWPQAAAGGDRYIFFSGAEASFVEAASARMIPKDELGPGALEAGVPQFIDRQLAGDFGRAATWYMQGPWAEGLKTQGYQNRRTPAQFYRAAIPAIDHVAGGGGLAGLAAADQDALLKRVAAGQPDLGSDIDGKAFFALLLQNVMEGFFSDPIYGGNRGMAGWKLIGFPGARYDQTPYVKAHGQPYPLPPVGISGRPEWSVKS